MGESPYEYHGYTDEGVQILSSLRDDNATPQKGFVVDLYGVKTRVDDTLAFWPEASSLETQILGLPIPGNFHWGAIEWIGLMRAVLKAEQKFRIMELGAAWGPAAVSGGVLARLRGITDIRMTAVEGDPHYHRRLIQHVEDNGFAPAQHRLYSAAVAVDDGVAQWPVTTPDSVESGFRPIEGDGDYMNRTFASTMDVTLMSMSKLVQLEDEWDLIHMDIQGSEFDVCKAAMPDLTARAKRVLIGTHSRKIEGQLLSLFDDAGWVLENERPCKFYPQPTFKSWEQLNAVDGTQIWANPRLTSAL